MGLQKADYAVGRMDGVEKAVDCNKEFECYKLETENDGRAKAVGDGTVFECLRKEPGKCEYGFCFGSSYFCKCPLRTHMSKSLKA
jgi:hypothetical protein